jgi:peptide/nickel transport system substrate-binding protein
MLLGGMLAVFVCSTGAALAQKSGGILKMYHRDNPPTLSPHETATNSTVIPIMPVMNNLVMFDQSKPQNSPQTIVPDLAKSWTWSADGKALVFKLQEGVKWHDGKPFTAQDVVCTFDLLLGKSENKLRANRAPSWYTNVERSRPTRTCRRPFISSARNPRMLTLLASGYSPIYPCHVTPAQMRTKPIGTGPSNSSSSSRTRAIKIARTPTTGRRASPTSTASSSPSCPTAAPPCWASSPGASTSPSRGR